MRRNREDYRQKFSAVRTILAEAWATELPSAGFYLWPQTPGDDIAFTRALFEHTNVTLLPGQFLSRATPQGDPGAGRVRLA